MESKRKKVCMEKKRKEKSWELREKKQKLTRSQSKAQVLILYLNMFLRSLNPLNVHQFITLTQSLTLQPK